MDNISHWTSLCKPPRPEAAEELAHEGRGLATVPRLMLNRGVAAAVLSCLVAAVAATLFAAPCRGQVEGRVWHPRPLQPRGPHLRQRRPRCRHAAEGDRLQHGPRDLHGQWRHPRRHRPVRRPSGTREALPGAPWRARARRERGHREASRRPPCKRHDHEPPERRPRVLRPAGWAVGLPGDGRGREVQPAADLRVLVHADGRRRPHAVRPREPALGRRDHDDRPRQGSALHRPRGDRLPEPRPVQDRRALQPG